MTNILWKNKKIWPSIIVFSYLWTHTIDSTNLGGSVTIIYEIEIMSWRLHEPLTHTLFFTNKAFPSEYILSSLDYKSLHAQLWVGSRSRAIINQACFESEREKGKKRASQMRPFFLYHRKKRDSGSLFFLAVVVPQCAALDWWSGVYAFTIKPALPSMISSLFSIFPSLPGHEYLRRRSQFWLGIIPISHPFR